jgi:hypothetical protein
MPSKKYAFDIYSYQGRPSATNGCSQRLVEGTYEEAVKALEADIEEESKSDIRAASYGVTTELSVVDLGGAYDKDVIKVIFKRGGK